MPSQTPDDRDPNQAPATPASWRLWLSGGPRKLWGWLAANRLRAGLVAAVCLVLLVGLVLGTLAITASSTAEQPATIEMALEAFDGGRYLQASQLAKQLEEQGTLAIQDFGVPAFVLGAAAAHEADSTWSKDKTGYYLVAARYLEEARDRGFPAGREATGLYLLGKSLYHSGQVPASRLVLQAALKVNPDRQAEIHALLADAYLNDSNPQLDKALEQNTLLQESLADGKRYLAGTAPGGLGSLRAARQQALLQRAQILFRLGRIAECTAALDEVPPQANNYVEAVILRGCLLMQEAETLLKKADATSDDQQAARQKYQAAIKTLRLAQGRDTLDAQATRKAMYLIGVCLLETGDYRAALDQLTRTARLFPGTAEATAADLQKADLARQLGKDAAALAAYRRALASVTDPDNLRNPWITLDQFRHRILSAYQDYLKNQNFEICLRLTEQCYPLFSRVRTLELSAELYEAWGQALLARAARLFSDESSQTRHRGLLQLRRAGRIYYRLARLQVATRKYADQLWNSANAFFQGQDYSSTVTVLRRYMKGESRRYPQALVLFGRAMLAQGQIDEALETFHQCIDSFPRDAATFQARVCASRAYVEKGDLQKAEALLRENLKGQQLAPASQEWRDSLFDLGELLHTEKRYDEAITDLEEALKRYSDDPRALSTEYHIADCYRQRAISTQEKLRQESAGPPPADQLTQIDRDFRQALAGFQRIEGVLSKRLATAELAPREEPLLRNCYFMIGDILLDLGQYQAAIKAYSTATSRYQDRPEVLLAYVQMANAYRRLGKPEEARDTAKRAKKVLEHMDTALQFSATTNYSRQEWSELLDSLARL